MMAMLRRFMLLLLKSDNGWSTISPENRDPLFRITLKTWNSLSFDSFEHDLCGKPVSTFPDHARGAPGAQKGSPAKRTGQTLLVAAQYSQKSRKNNEKPDFIAQN